MIQCGKSMAKRLASILELLLCSNKKGIRLDLVLCSILNTKQLVDNNMMRAFS